MRAITDWLTRRREAAALDWVVRDAADRARWVKNHRTARARRRLARWDRALDWWTKDGTRHSHGTGDAP